MPDIPVEFSDRGFSFQEPFTTDYGHVLSVSESSAAKGPCLWLRIDASKSLIDEDRGKDISVHLTAKQAKHLRKALKQALRDHYQYR